MNALLIDIVPFRPLIQESRERPGIYEVVGTLQRAGTKNQNGRIYTKQVLERECEKYLKEFVEMGNAFGELDHPESAVVSLKNASHVVKKLWWEGEELKGKLELLNTPAGNIVKEIITGGHTIGISSRGTGSVKETNEGTLMVQDDFSLVCWDFVSNPSTHGAFMKPTSLNESKNTIVKYLKLNTIINEILRS
jgi:hypothetical protein